MRTQSVERRHNLWEDFESHEIASSSFSKIENKRRKKERKRKKMQTNKKKEVGEEEEETEKVYHPKRFVSLCPCNANAIVLSFYSLAKQFRRLNVRIYFYLGIILYMYIHVVSKNTIFYLHIYLSLLCFFVFFFFFFSLLPSFFHFLLSLLSFSFPFKEKHRTSSFNPKDT